MSVILFRHWHNIGSAKAPELFGYAQSCTDLGAICVKSHRLVCGIPFFTYKPCVYSKALKIKTRKEPSRMKDRLNQLERDVETMRQTYDQRFDRIESRILKVEDALQSLHDLIQPLVNRTDAQTDAQENRKPSSHSPDVQSQLEALEPENALATTTPHHKELTGKTVTQKVVQESQNSDVSATSHPTNPSSSRQSSVQNEPSSWVEQAVRPASRSWDVVLEQSVAPWLGPFSELLTGFISVYRHYKKEDKAPVFFMTLAGIVAMVFGVGYLFQYSMNEYLGAAGKTTLGTFGAMSVMGLGMWLSKRQSTMSEFGSGLISLGVILLYLCTYFGGIYFQLMPQWCTFILLSLLMLLTMGISRWFETQVIAVISVVGATTIPMLIPQEQQNLSFYLTYLTFTLGLGLVWAHQLRWTVLGYLSLILCCALMEWITLGFIDRGEMISSSPAFIHWLVMIHVAFYFGVFYGLSRLWLSSENRVSKATAHTTTSVKWLQLLPTAIASTTVAFMTQLLLLSQIIWLLDFYDQSNVTLGSSVSLASNMILGPNVILGIVFLLNGLVYLSITLWTVRLNVKHHWLMTLLDHQRQQTFFGSVALMSAIFIGVGCLALCSPQWMGVIWGVEGLLLLGAGVYLGLRSLRIEGTVITLMVMAGLLLKVLLWLFDDMSGRLPWIHLQYEFAWFEGLVLIALLLTSLLLWHRHFSQHHIEKNHWYRVAKDALVIAVAVQLWVTLGLWWPEGFFTLVTAPMFFLLYCASRCSYLKAAERVGLGLFAFLFIPVFYSIVETNSFSFRDQLLIAQIARVELLLGLIAVAQFYRRLNPNSSFAKLAHWGQILFFVLIPIIFARSVFKELPEAGCMGLWIACLMVLGFYHQFRYSALRWQWHVSVVLASLFSITSAFPLWGGAWESLAVLNVACGAVFFLGLLWYWRGYQRIVVNQRTAIQKLLPFTHAVGFFYLWVALGLLIFDLTLLPYLALLAMSSYLTIFLVGGRPFLEHPYPPIRPCYKAVFLTHVTMTGLNALIVMLSVYEHMVTGEFEWNHFINLLVLSTSVVMLGVVLHQSSQINRLIQRSLGGRQWMVVAFQALLLCTYLPLQAYVSGQYWGPVLTIMLVIHGAALLMASLYDETLKLFIKIAVGVFVLVFVKILAFDMAGFSMFEKMIAFMGMGGILLLAAYGFQLLKNHRDKDQLL